MYVEENISLATLEKMKGQIYFHVHGKNECAFLIEVKGVVEEII